MRIDYFVLVFLYLPKIELLVLCVFPLIKYEVVGSIRHLGNVKHQPWVQSSVNMVHLVWFRPLGWAFVLIDICSNTFDLWLFFSFVTLLLLFVLLMLLLLLDDRLSTLNVKILVWLFFWYETLYLLTYLFYLLQVSKLPLLIYILTQLCLVFLFNFILISLDYSFLYLSGSLFYKALLLIFRTSHKLCRSVTFNFW